MQAKIKVDVEKLIAAIEDRRAEVVAKAAADLLEYPAKLDKWKTESFAMLDLWRDRVTAGKDVRRYYQGDIADPPVKPEAQTGNYDRDIATLRMASETSISITADDYGRYLR